jgi:hypothetical protein
LVDTAAPSFNITGDLVISQSVTAGSGNATVHFPAMAATDDVTTEPIISCTYGAAEPLRFIASQAEEQRLDLAVRNEPVTVTCWATDEANNKSPDHAFEVRVSCQEGYSLDSTGVCTGGARHPKLTPLF